MPPPPVTPSPHRFVIKKERPAIRSTPLAQEHTPHLSTQFNSTPRFTFPSTPRPTASQTLPPPRFAPSTARFATPARGAGKSYDAIELDSDDGVLDVQDSIEVETEEQDGDVGEGYLSEELEDDYKVEERSPKRRRLSTSSQIGLEEQEAGDDDEEMLLDNEDNNNEAEPSSSLPILSSPPAPRRVLSTTAPRFLLSTPLPQSTPTEILPTPFLKPPRFRPPDPSENTETQSDPLPDQFSPHRKGQKYIPGGLAAEVRDWLINLESAIPASGGGKRDGEWVVRVMVDDIKGGLREGMTLVRGRQVVVVGNEDGGGKGGEMVDTLGVVKVILAGEGAGSGLQKGKAVEKGKMVGIKGPVWDVVIEGEKWGVGVDWKVL
ncbi:hypothetical protein VTL71DRAFT_12912 [Oculimacula yallundae]|uniref:Uncharacterized protein n=1 Tax=Oculimacula yallundae TaxID=86028 RepID=A0ABR4CNU1_9HELO